MNNIPQIQLRNAIKALNGLEKQTAERRAMKMAQYWNIQFSVSVEQSMKYLVGQI